MLFATRKPRRFYHPYIYVDERKERLEERVGKVRRELGLEAGRTPMPEDVRGRFAGGTRRLERRRRSARRPWSLTVLLLLIGLAVALWYVLDRGLT